MIELYHASPRADLATFRPLTHLGTRDAALDRARRWESALLYSVELDASKILRVPDFMPSDNRSALHTWMRLVDQLHYDVKPRVLSAQDRADVFAAGRPTTVGSRTVFDDEAACAKLAQLLSGRWDALSYINEFEDRGSVSYIILDPARVKITGMEALGVPPARSPSPAFGGP